MKEATAGGRGRRSRGEPQADTKPGARQRDGRSNGGGRGSRNGGSCGDEVEGKHMGIDKCVILLSFLSPFFPWILAISQ